jgi:ATP-dependent Clp protease protease subunit
MRNKDDFDTYLTYGIHIHNRKIFFGAPLGDENSDEFNHTSVSLAIRAIDLMVSMNSKPIELHMSSFGGSSYQMMALKDKILESPVKILFYGSGVIASSATWIMCTCDERYLSHDTTVMIHNGGTHTVDGVINLTDQTIQAEEDERLQDRLNEVFAENSRMPKEFWDAVVQRDCFMTAHEALLLGLVDDLIPHKKRGAFRKKRQAKLEAHPTKRQMESVTKKLLKRVKMDKISKNIAIHVPADATEEFKTYDNTENELKKLVSEQPTIEHAPVTQTEGGAKDGKT